MNLAAAGDGIAANKEAAFRVESSISVREQYKTKLRVLLDALQPESSPKRLHTKTQSLPSSYQNAALVVPAKATTEASKKKQNRDALADRLRVRATMPAGKELQVVGDWLLLLRAASVNVVESIEHWRHVIHQDRPLPYEVDHTNYLLEMAHDTDFLDQYNDLVAWLGFRLVRNPFIVAGGLEGNSLNAEDTPSVSPSVKLEGRGKRQSASTRAVPPSTLVKPLVSITPEDDVVDGSRIQSAQAMLKGEEALYGRAKVSRLVEAYLKKSPEVSQLDSSDNFEEIRLNCQASKTLFDAVAGLTKMVRRSEHTHACFLREQSRAMDLVTLVEDQIRMTNSHHNQDFVRDHRVWQYRDKCRAATLRVLEDARDQLMRRVESVQTACVNSQELVSKQKKHLSQLITHRDNARQRHVEEKSRAQAKELARRKAAIRHKTAERNRTFKVERVKFSPPTADTDCELPSPSLTNEQAPDNDLVDEIAIALGAPASPVDCRIELDQKRVDNLERRRLQRIQQEQAMTDETREMNRRRGENAQMFLEDRLSRLVEARRRLVLRERYRKERAKRLAATPICSFVQTVGGVGSNSDKKFVISVYQHRAKGYAPEGLRFVAYDPATSSSLTLMVSKREYNTLGYGRTLEGLTAFCQWLCIIYEKRRRQFKLVWSGAPCPPPLRFRECDHALVCVHQEGIRLVLHSERQASRATFLLTAVYVRTNNPSKLRFVVTPLDIGGHVTEFAVTAPELLPKRSILLRSEGEGARVYASWIHTLHEECDDNVEGFRSYHAKGTRIFSGETSGIEDVHPVRVQMFDVSSTEYELYIDIPRDNGLNSLTLPQRPIILLKREVNPYGVRLPGSAFGELMDCIRLERSHRAGAESESVDVVARILPSWRTRLARYVRAIRMARFGCKVDGVFHFIIVTLVQQKTEFRAHLVFELTPIGEAGWRHSLQISLSQFLRCPDTNVLAGDCVRVDHDERARACDVCTDNCRRLACVSHDNSLNIDSADDPPNIEGWQCCTLCEVTQVARLAILRTLLHSGTLESDSDLDTMYYAVCSACKTFPPPIAVVVPCQFNENGGIEHERDDAVLRHYFSCFDEDTHLNADQARRIRETLEENRICVIRVTGAPIGTRSSAAGFADRWRQFLHLEQYRGLPVTITIVFRELDIFRLDSRHESVGIGPDSSSDIAVDGVLRDTAAAILRVAETPPIANEVEGQDSISNFEGYLVSEALLVEATRVILHPDAEWRVPGETVGASSWSSACEFLRDPQQLSKDLHDRHSEILSMNHHARNILEQYIAHPKWPTSLGEVRLPFQNLLSCVQHISYAQHILDLAGGLLSADNNHLGNSVSPVGEGIYTLERGTIAVVIPNHVVERILKARFNKVDFIE